MNRNTLLKIKVIFVFIVLHIQLSAQDHIITGIVKDAETKQPLDFCSIILLKSTQEQTRMKEENLN